MLKEIYKFPCFQMYQSKNPEHLAQVKELFNASKTFANFRDVPCNPNLKWWSSDSDWQLYMNHLDVYLPQPYWNWDNFSRNCWKGNPNGFLPNATKDGEMFSDFSKGCKQMGIVPIYCWGTSEESAPNDWLGRAPGSDKWKFIKRFMKEFCIFINKKYGFKKCVIELWNEPVKTFGLYNADWYKQIAAYMAEGVKSANLGYEVWFNSNDLQHQNYIDQSINYEPLIKNVDRITTHCNSRDEWDWRNSNGASYIQLVNLKIHQSKICLKYGMVNQVVSELSPVSGLNDYHDLDRQASQLKTFKERFNYLKGKTSGYGVLAIPFINDIVFTGDIDEVGVFILYDREINGTSRKSGFILGRNEGKYQFLKSFNGGWK